MPEEAVLTEPRDMQRERETEAATDPGPEVRPEVIKDLDVTGDDAGDIAAGGTGCFNAPSIWSKLPGRAQ